MHPIRSGPAWARSTASRDRLIVSEVVGAEGEIVHAALTGGTNAEGLEDHIDDTLRGEDVAGADGGGGRRIEKTGLGDVDGDWGETAVVQWDVGVDDTPKGEDNG